MPPRARELYDNYDYDSDMMYEDSTAAADYNDYDYDTQRDDRDSGYGSGSGGGYNDGIAVLSEFPIPLFVRFRHVLFWEFPCPAWAVASCSGGPHAGGTPKNLAKISL